MRTPEQIEADDNLTEAIERLHRAYHDDVDGVLTKYIVLAQRQNWDEEGDQVTTNYSSPRGDGMPLSDQMGLVEFAAARYRSQAAGSW